MTDTLAQRARRLLELDGKATPGLWEPMGWAATKGDAWLPEYFVAMPSGAPAVWSKDDVMLIAAARNDAPDLARAYLALLDERAQLAADCLTLESENMRLHEESEALRTSLHEDALRATRDTEDDA